MRWLHLTMLICILGCRGPLNAPMVTRLPPEEQHNVDEAWRNMLTPADRLDRLLLLDVLLMSNFYQQGVDHLEMTAVKQVPPYSVVMEVTFDRGLPQADAFTVTVLDGDGRLVRQDEFAREDVEGRMKYIYAAASAGPEVIRYEEMDPATLTPEQRTHLDVLRRTAAEWAARAAEIQAATQPAGAR